MSSSQVTDNSYNYAEKGEGGAPLRVSLTAGGHPIDRSEPAFPSYHRKFGNPGPLGLCAFALTTFLLSLINVGARGVHTPAVVVAPALIYGGFAQMIAGTWEIACGQTFGGTVFTSYGGFWISYALIVSPWSGIGAAYTEAADFENVVGFFLVAWTIFTLICLVASLRSSVALTSTLFFLTLAFICLSAQALGPAASADGLGKAGGVLGLITAFNAWYVAAAGLLTPETSYFILPVGNMSRK